MIHVPNPNSLAGAHRYRRHQPETTLLYQVVEQYYPEFAELMRRQGRQLPTIVHREFINFLQCGRLEFGFLRVRCQECGAEKLVAFSCKGRGFCPSCGVRRMVDTAALLVLDGVYVQRPDSGVRFVPVPAPTSTELQRLVERIGYRVGRHLERRGLLVRDAERAYLEWDSEQASTFDDLVCRQFVRYDSIASIARARDTAGISFVFLIRKG